MFLLQNSWYLKNNGLHHFFCTCGNYNVLDVVKVENPYLDMIEFKREEIDFTKISELTYHPDNQCDFCGNERYLDMKSLLFESKTRYWSNVKWDYEKKIDTNSWSIVSFLNIPKFDENIQKIVIEKLELSRFVIEKNGNSSYVEYVEKVKYFLKKILVIDEEYFIVEKILKNKMSQNIANFMLKNPSESLAWLEGEEKLENILFFLKNPKLRFKDIIYWQNKEYFLDFLSEYQYLEPSLAYILNHRKEKSVRKAQFKSYKKMMSEGGYSPMADYIFSRTIEDVNHLLRALNMDTDIKKKLFLGCNIVNTYLFIDFLKKYYEEKHIVKFWLSITKDDLNHFLLRDTTDMFNTKELREELIKRFRKTALNIRSIHHELTNCSRELKIENQEKAILEYSDFIFDSQVTRENITYMLPMSSKILHSWGISLGNCIYSYFHKVSMGKTIIFGLFIDEKLTYAIEIVNHKIVQASSSYNRPIPKLDREKIDKWFKEVYLKNYIIAVYKIKK